jgi:hypothetical protein
MVVIGRPRLAELAVPTDRAGDSDRRSKEHSLFLPHFFYLWFPYNGDPPFGMKGRVICLGKTPRQISIIPHHALASL